MMNSRFLGALCIVGSFAALLGAFRTWALGGDVFDTVDTILLMIWCVGSIAGLASLIQLNGVGPSPVARALAFLPMIGFALLILSGIVGLVAPVASENDTLAGIGWVVQMAGMVLVGILTIAAKRWQGWRRFVPLLTVVLVPIGFGIGSVVGGPSFGAFLIYLTWLLLGYVVATAESAPELQGVTAWPR
jgi:hypothetical protein